MTIDNVDAAPQKDSMLSPLNAILLALGNLYPNNRYPVDSLENELKEKGKVDSDIINKFSAELSDPKWMRNIGYFPIEPVMRTYTKKYSAPGYETFEETLCNAFHMQPLLGNIILTEQQRLLLYRTAVYILNLALKQKKPLTIVEHDILVLETVILLQAWDNYPDGAEDFGFWEFICSQYGLRYDNFGASDEYRLFRDCIDYSLRTHKRVLADKGHKYYTTMLTHAMAPKRKFFDLFEQIFYFYARNLQYQYIANDPAFLSFSLEMKRRFTDTQAASDDSVYIRSVQSSSAIVLLFTQCPFYMVDFVEIAVRTIDGLVEGREAPAGMYLESLLREWYRLRSEVIREEDRKGRQRRSLERIVTDFRSIKLAYLLKNNRLTLIVPSIRLGEQKDDLPTLQLYCKDTFLRSDKLQWYGDRFCITSVKTEIDLSEALPQSDDISYRAVITYGGEKIFDSELLLHRTAIMFDDNGYEIKSRPEDGHVLYLFAPRTAIVDEKIKESRQCELLDCPAQLYRVIMQRSTDIIVNGQDLLPSLEVSGDICIEKPGTFHKSAVYVHNQTEYLIYADTPVIFTSIRENCQKKYHAVIDGQAIPLSACVLTQGKGWQLSPYKSGEAHEVKLIDNETRKTLYKLHFVVWPDFDIDFQNYQSFISKTNGLLVIRDAMEEHVLPYASTVEDSRMRIPYRNGELVVEVPQFRAVLDGRDMGQGCVDTIWHEDIPAGARLEIHPPPGYWSEIRFGDICTESPTFELGNKCRAYHARHQVERLSVRIYRNGYPDESVELLNIAFKPYMKSEPLAVSRHSLRWVGALGFVGGNDARFTLRFIDKTGYADQYELGLENAVLQTNFQPPDGVYRYEVYVHSTSFFSEERQDLFKGRLIVGDFMKLRFSGQALNVTEAFLMDQIDTGTDYSINFANYYVKMRSLEYLGRVSLNGEAQTYPCYRGILQFRDYDKYRPFSYKEVKSSGRSKYQVNPALVWIINDNLISLRTISEDGLWVDKEKNRLRIMNRISIPKRTS